MLPTPDTSHLSFSTIYEPAEDSYLFLDTLSLPAETTFLKSCFPQGSASPLVLEVGTGSGVITAFVMMHAEHVFGRTDILTMGVDVNFDACMGTAETVRRAVNGGEEKGTGGECTKCVGMYVGNVCGDLTMCIRPRSVDLLVFNPPYVPTEDMPILPDYGSIHLKERFEKESHLLALSYAGGEDGMETTNRLLKQLPDVLSDRGVAYVLLCARNKPREVEGSVKMWKSGDGWAWRAEIVEESGGKGGWERLGILRIWREREREEKEV